MARLEANDAKGRENPCMGGCSLNLPHLQLVGVLLHAKHNYEHLFWRYGLIVGVITEIADTMGWSAETSTKRRALTSWTP